jgi:hypothetical protein
MAFNWDKDGDGYSEASIFLNNPSDDNEEGWGEESESESEESPQTEQLEEEYILDEEYLMSSNIKLSPPSKKQIAYELDDQESGVVNQAMIRLEQARLYDMLIKHDFFEGVDVNPIALRNVQNELKSYIVERLEILMGMKSDRKPLNQKIPTSINIELPFNDIEIDFLKQLSYKGTKGESAKMSPKVSTISLSSEEEDNEEPVVVAPRGINKLSNQVQSLPRPITSSSTPKKTGQVIVNKEPAKKQPQEKRKKFKTEDEEIMEIAKRELEQGSVNPYNMTEEELLERNSKIKSGQNSSRSLNKIPPVTGETMLAHYQTQSATRSQNPDDLQTFNAALARMLTKGD